MSSLLDTLDRFNNASSSIRSLASSQPPRTEPGPFTSAILQRTLHDLLREADESEYGVFTLVRDPSDTPQAGVIAQGKIGRREFRGATPLKAKRVPRAGTNGEEEPEVYIEAAVKYLDRFHAVKPMPHARTRLDSLIERLNNVRDNIDMLQESLESASQSGRASPKSQVAEEERRISELRSRILQLRKRKEALSAKLPAASKPPLRGLKPGARKVQPNSKMSTPPSVVDSPSSTHSTPTSHISNPKSKLKPQPIPLAQGRSRVSGPPPGKSISRGDTEAANKTLGDDRDNGRLFWSGGKPFRFATREASGSDSLLDEELDMTGMDSFMSPTPSMPSRAPNTPETPARDIGDRNVSAHPTSPEGDRFAEKDDDDSDSGEPTIVVSKIAQPGPATAPPSPPPSRSASQASGSEPQTPAQGRNTTVPPSTKTKVRRLRVTPEVERICAKIWSAIPDLLVPGNNFSSKKPPNAKDTITVLQTIAAQPLPDPSTPSISSPSTRSTLSSLLGIETLGPAGGSPHQIMTAHVLLSLLTAPNHGIPLTELKALLTSKAAVPSPGLEAGREAKQSAAAMGASAAQAGTRALYGCVAKKLVKIDRGGGEQIVKFN